MTTFVPLSTQPVFLKGQLQVGAQISVYDAGTLTPRSVYGDGLLANLLAQPVLSDVNGCIPNMWVVGNAYRIRIVAPSGVFIRDVDNLPADTGVGAPPPPPPPPGTQTLSTGDMVWSYGTAGNVPGRVRANGRTIGNASSGASERANADCQNLFTWLWNGDPNLVVVGGRGGTALADWNANKSMTLPDFRGRTPFGLDDMGNAPAGRLANALFSLGGPTTIGATGGEGAHTLTIAEAPSHTHTATTQSAGSHQHTFTTASAGSHNHSGATGYENQAHQHTGTTDSENVTHYHGLNINTDTQGSHNHTGATAGDSPAHTHNVPNTTGAPYSLNPGANPSAFIYQPGANLPTGGPNQAHTHGIATDGAHAHNVNGFTGTQSANHTHTFTSGTETVAHNHNIATDGAHQHTGVVDAAGIHTHTLTSDPTGGGSPHNSMPPFILITFYLVL